MACIQANIYRPSLGRVVNGQDKRLRRTSSTSAPSSLQASCLFLSALRNSHQNKAYPRLVYNGSRYKRLAPVCAFGGKGKSESDNDPFSFESLKKAMGGFKREKSVQDLLREQMQEREYGGDGGNRDSGGGGGNNDGSGGSEDEGFAGMLDEMIQVALATIAFIFVRTTKEWSQTVDNKNQKNLEEKGSYFCCSIDAIFTNRQKQTTLDRPLWRR